MSEMQPKPIKETVEVLDALKELAKAYKSVVADSKIDLQDLPTVVGLLAQFGKMQAAYEGVKEVPMELKDLSQEEAQQLLAKVFEIIAVLKA